MMETLLLLLKKESPSNADLIIRSLLQKAGGIIISEVKEPRAFVVSVDSEKRILFENSTFMEVKNVILRPRPIMRIRVSADKSPIKYIVCDNKIMRVEGHLKKQNHKSFPECESIWIWSYRYLQPSFMDVSDIK